MKPDVSFEDFKTKQKWNNKLGWWAIGIGLTAAIISVHNHWGWLLLFGVGLGLWFPSAKTDNIVTRTYRWPPEEVDAYYRNHPKEGRPIGHTES